MVLMPSSSSSALDRFGEAGLGSEMGIGRGRFGEAISSSALGRFGDDGSELIDGHAVYFMYGLLRGQPSRDIAVLRPQ